MQQASIIINSKVESNMHRKLDEILARKQKEVDRLRPYPSLKKALAQPGLSVIAEIKRKSPSTGFIGDIPEPRLLAEQYQKSGANAISILTDKDGFNGSLQDLSQVSLAIQEMPLLRKDFIIDPLQIEQSLRAGAHAVLLIVAALKGRIGEFIQEARRLHLETLVEVHTEFELETALKAGAEVIGVNNRDLNTFKVDLAVSERLIKLMPNHVIKVSESGIKTPRDAQSMHQLGFDAVLIGEALVQSNDVTQFIREAKNVD